MSSAVDQANEFLMSGGVPSAKFHEIGTVAKGRIEHLDVQQQRDFDTGEPKVYKDSGKPMMQLAITVATDERDPEISGDDGLRRIFAKGQMLDAIRAAVRQSGSQLTPGGMLAVKYVSDKPSDKPGKNPTKQYQAQYVAAAPTQGAVDDLLGSGGTSNTAVAAPAAPVAANDLI